MLNRKKTMKTGLNAILEVAGATMGDLGANLANRGIDRNLTVTCRNKWWALWFYGQIKLPT